MALEKACSLDDEEGGIRALRLFVLLRKSLGFFWVPRCLRFSFGPNVLVLVWIQLCWFLVQEDVTWIAE